MTLLKSITNTLVVALLVSLPMGALAQNGSTKAVLHPWTLIYENDDQGKRIQGDFNMLKKAIREARPVRISWKLTSASNKAVFVEHFADAKFITLLGDSAVMAQIDPIVGQTPQFSDKFISLKENAEWAFIASTTGNNDSMNTNLKTGEVIDHKPFRCGIKWFVEL